MSPFTCQQQRITHANGTWADLSLLRFPAEALHFADIVQQDHQVRLRDGARLRYYKARIRGEANPLVIAWACLEADHPAPRMFPTLDTITDGGEHLLSANAFVTHTLRELVRRGWLRWASDSWGADVPPGYAGWRERAEVVLGWLMAEGRLWLEAGPDHAPPTQTAFEGCDPLLHVTAVGRCGFVRDIVRQQLPRAAFNTSFFLFEHDDYLSHYSAWGDPYGLLVHDGVILRPPLYSRAVILSGPDGRWRAERMGMADVRLILPNGTVLCPPGDTLPGGLPFAVNPDEETGVALYTRHFGVSAHGYPLGRTPQAAGRFELVIIDRQVAGWKRGGGLLIPQNGYVLSFTAAEGGGPLTRMGGLAASITALRSLLKGGHLSYSFAHPRHQGIKRAIQAGPLLIQAGKPVLSATSFEEEEYWSSRQEGGSYRYGIAPTEFPLDINQSRAARIALGIDGEGDLLVLAISGTSKGIARADMDSAGATLEELTGYLLNAGATAAINLDGGGSTQVFVEGGLYNHPGDRRGRQGVAYERMVPTIGIVP